MRALSHERLSAYAQRATEQGNRTLFAHYAWNMALSESLYPVLQALEVLLRNTIDNAARDHFRRADWYDDPKLIRYPNDISSIDKARRILNRLCAIWWGSSIVSHRPTMTDSKRSLRSSNSFAE